MAAMHLSSLIDLKLVFLRSPMQDLREIYTFMVNQKNRQYPMSQNIGELVERLCSRNLDEGILFPTGAAIPHLHLDGLNDTIISVLIPDKPIQTEYGVIKIFFMVFSCASDNSLYMQILNSLVKISKDADFYDRILKAKSPQDFKKILKAGDHAIKQALTVSDVMDSKVITVTENTTLKELSQLFYEHNFGYFPVVDEKGIFVGEVTLSDYLMASFPEYIKSLNNLNFLRAFEPFEQLIKDEGNLKVKTVMKPIEVSIKPDSSIVEAVFLINKYKRRDIPVLEGNNIVGIISFMNIFRKVIKG